MKTLIAIVLILFAVNISAAPAGKTFENEIDKNLSYTFFEEKGKTIVKFHLAVYSLTGSVFTGEILTEAKNKISADMGVEDFGFIPREQLRQFDFKRKMLSGYNHYIVAFPVQLTALP